MRGRWPPSARPWRGWGCLGYGRRRIRQRAVRLPLMPLLLLLLHLVVLLLLVVVLVVLLC
jgi:hypothetical protein